MSKTGKEAQEVTIEKVGSHVDVFGAYSRRELRDMLLSSLSLFPTIDEKKLVQTLTYTGLSKEDLTSIKDGEVQNEQTKETLKHLKITKEMISETIGTTKTPEKSMGPRGSQRSKSPGSLRKPEDPAESEEPEEPGRPKVPIGMVPLLDDLDQFLRSKGLSDDLMNRILKSGPTDEMIRLLRALGFTEEEISKLSELWKASTKLQGPKLKGSSESCVAISSSSEDFLSFDSLYLKSSFRKPLTEALQDVLAKKPFNPVEYLGHWLLHFKVCQEREERQKEYDAELLAEREKIKMLDNVCSASGISGSGAEEAEEDWNFMEYEDM